MQEGVRERQLGDTSLIGPGDVEGKTKAPKGIKSSVCVGGGHFSSANTRPDTFPCCSTQQQDGARWEERVYHFPLLEAAQTVTCLHARIFLSASKTLQPPSSRTAAIMKWPQIISVTAVYIKPSVLIARWKRAALKARGNTGLEEREVCCRDCLS